MTLALPQTEEARRGALPSAGLWLLALATLVILWWAGTRWPFLSDPVKLFVVPLADWISTVMDWLVKDLDFGLFTFKEFTRAIAFVFGLPLRACIALLANGWSMPFVGLEVPPVPWFGVLAAFTFLAYRLGGRRTATLVFACFAYLVVFDQWTSAMVTLSSILVAVPIGVIGGGFLGILAHRSRLAERLIVPCLDLMQTVPVFAYLVPVLFLFGFGPVSAMIATIIYAMPPMVRVTMLALRGVSTDVVEFGHMAGCTRRQMLWRIELPSARAGLLVGINQVIMLSLNMVIIASMIGAGGLGRDVLTSLRRLAIGDGLEAGLAITLLAIAIDRMSRAFVERRKLATDARRDRGFAHRHGFSLGFAALILVSWAAVAVFPGLAVYPKSLVIDTGPFWDELVRWINVHLYDYLDAVKAFLLIYVLIPFKRFLVDAPWLGVIAVLAVAGWRLSGAALAASLAAMAAFVALTGNWEKAMISVYLCGISVVVASLIGIAVGILAAGSQRIHRFAGTLVDTLQTLPSFVYLIPVVMLFQVGDFSAMIAIVLYAVAPAIRYTDHGLRQVPEETVEAARMAGARPGQILWRVRLPLALPQIMLGVNQTIMMALSMLVITALVGTNDLGQEVYIALTRANTGAGIVAGLSVACIAMIADRLIRGWTAQRQRRLAIG